MFRHLLDSVVFILGLAVVCWIGAGYLGSNHLALLVTLLIGAGYVVGGLELLRYRRATTTLERSVAELSAPPASLEQWLEQLDPSLRNATRLRIEGQRVALPGPALTPYLVGLLVLLGMGLAAAFASTGSAAATGMVVALAVVSFIVLSLVHAALSGIYSAALYRFAAVGEGSASFTPAVLTDAFKVKA